MKYLHVIPAEGSYSFFYTIKKLQKEVNLNEHKFLVTTCKSGVIKYYPKLLAFTDLQFVREVNKHRGKFKRLFEFYKELKDAEHIIWYSFSRQRYSFMLPIYFSNKIIKKSIWLRLPREEFLKGNSKKYKDKIFKHIYFSVIRKISTIGFFSSIDKYRFERMNKNNIKNKNIKTFDLPIFVSEERIRKLKEIRTKVKSINNTIIQITDEPANRCALFSILEALTKFSQENIKIGIPINYGFYYHRLSLREKQYIQKIKRFADKKMKDKVTIWNSPISEDVFIRYLSYVDILILNMNIPSRYTNLLYFLYLGKKVFLPQNTTVYSYFHNLGITVFDLKDISQLTFDKLMENNDQSIGQAWAAERLESNIIMKKWNNFFENI